MESGALVMSGPTRRLPANRAFVVQLRAETEEPEIRHQGRVEHLASGQAARFAGEDEFWTFVDSVLTAAGESSLAESREQDP
jgi:hypothetical protein